MGDIAIRPLMMLGRYQRELPDAVIAAETQEDAAGTIQGSKR
jgi:hypothetical protein